MKQLSCILIALAIVGVYSDEPEQLVNGKPADIKNFPHCVSLRMNNNHFCGGSIIDKQYILTAAHCLTSVVYPSQRTSMTVVSGTTYLTSGGKAYKVANVWIHELYNPNDPSGRGPYDIGLVKLSSPIQFDSTTQPIKLPTRDIAMNEAVTIAAWGSTGFRRPIHTDLQQLSAKAMLPATCQSYHQNSMRIHQQAEFCTLISHGTGLCNGDSGSGLIRDSDRTIIGLVSGGRPCAVGYPDVYTNVYSYNSWIRQKMMLY